MRDAESSVAKTVQLPSDQEASGRSLGKEELELLQGVIESGVLTSTKGTWVREFEHRFAQLLGARHAYACSSGTAAIHAAIAALDPGPGDEVVTTPITDMGALTPILYQSAVPVFADVDRRTLNVTAATIEPCLSERTRAIMVTHLFGNPCEMKSILALANKHGVPVIEDCAQAFLARSAGELVGTLGKVGCFSLQQGKHITTGEGGVVVTDDDELARRMFLFINKAWGYGDPKPDHYFLALNGRMSELQGAVAAAQLEKLDTSVQRRVFLAELLSQRISDLDGLAIPWVRPGDVHTYWRYCPRVDGGTIPGGGRRLATALKERGIAASHRYIQKPAFQCEIFRSQRTFGSSRFPFTEARPEALDYNPERFPGAFAGLEDVVVLPWNERLTEEHVALMARSIAESLSAAGIAE